MELTIIHKFLLSLLLTSIPVAGLKTPYKPKIRPFLCHPAPRSLEKFQTLEKTLTMHSSLRSLENIPTTHQQYNDEAEHSFEGTSDSLSVSTAENLSSDDGICREGWDMWEHSCYYFAVNERGTFSEVEHICREKGAYLASVLSTEEQEYMRDIAKQRVVVLNNSNPDKNVWIGGSDLIKEGNWKWTDGQPFSFSNWEPDQPNNVNDQDCLIYRVKTGLWEDVDCEVNWGYVCKKNIDELTKCDEGWKRWSSDCYLFEFEKKLTWLNAHYYCQEYGSYLLSLRSLEEQEYLQVSMSYESETNLIWTGGRNFGEIWSWSDGADFKLLNDVKEYPHGTSESNCLTMDPEAGIWEAKSCTNLFGFVCKKLEKDRRVCEEGWKVWGEHCYFLESNLMKNWEDAQETCQRNGNFLVSIQSAAEEAFIKDLSQALPHVNLPPGIARTVWIGANIAFYGQSGPQQAGSWQWIDGTVALYSNFGDSSFMDKCIRLDIDTREWIISDCSTETAFICKKERYDMQKCSEGWIHWGNSCYSAETKEATWFKAQEHCRHNDSYLSSVLSQEEFLFIHRMMAYKIPKQQPEENALIWTGGNDLVFEYNWRWSDGMTSSYSHSIFDAYSDETEEDCMGIYQPLFTWQTWNCTDGLNYVCKTEDAVSQKCPKGWKVWGAHCYLFNFDVKGDWTDAQANCAIKGAYLVSITSWEEQAFLETPKVLDKQLYTSQLHTYCEADMEAAMTLEIRQLKQLRKPRSRRMSEFEQQTKSLTINKIWTGGYRNDKNKSWKWNDGRTMDFTNWQKGYPSDDDKKLCAAMILTSGQWKSLLCSQETGISSVCKKTTLDVSPCPEGWDQWFGYCYLFQLLNEYLTWQDARDECENRNGELLSISSADENNFIKATLQEKLDNTLLNSESVWIGFNDLNKEGSFEWTNGRTVNFTDWGDNQPNNWDGQDCVVLNIFTGWGDVKCSAQRNYVCKLAVPLQ